VSRSAYGRDSLPTIATTVTISPAIRYREAVSREASGHTAVFPVAVWPVTEYRVGAGRSVRIEVSIGSIQIFFTVVSTGVGVDSTVGAAVVSVTAVVSATAVSGTVVSGDAAR
jgi:hypothetical protein